jgi:hypothetical protein
MGYEKLWHVKLSPCDTLPSLLQYHSIYFLVFILLVRFEVFTAVTMKNGVFWDVKPYGSCKNGRFGGTQHLLYQGDKNL